MNSESAQHLLQLMLEDLPTQAEIYQPTAFWAEASKEISTTLLKQGFEQFRSLPAIRSFFAPSYGTPFNRLKQTLFEQTMALADGDPAQQQVLNHMLNGQLTALADYRTMMAGNYVTDPMNLQRISESSIGTPAEQFQFDDKWFSRSFLNYLLGLTFLKQHVDTSTIQRVVEVGGGFGTLGEILAQSGEYAYINIDIPPTAAVSSYYLSNQSNIELIPYTATRNKVSLPFPKAGQQLVLCPWQLPTLQGEADLFVNFISFQEMEPDVVAHYLQQVERLNCRYVLLRNLREGKQQRTKERLGVETPTLGEDYDQFLPQYQLIDTNVTPFGFRTLDGFHSELRLYQRKSPTL